MKNPETVVVKIYELRDPRDLGCKPRYVGITTKPLNSRLSGHLTPRTLSTNNHKNSWIKSLLRNSIRPSIHLIEEVIGWKYACKVEQYWIKEFKEQGYNLTNSTEGGEGVVGYKISQEVIEKLRISSSLNYYKSTPYIYLQIPIYLFNINGEFIKYYISQSACSRDINVRTSNISQCIQGKQASIGKGKYFVTLSNTKDIIKLQLKRIQAAKTNKSMKISESNSRSITQKSINGGFIKKWNKASNAANELKIDLSSIIKCCKNKNKTAGGFEWEYN